MLRLSTIRAKCNVHASHSAPGSKTLQPNEPAAASAPSNYCYSLDHTNAIHLVVVDFFIGK